MVLLITAGVAAAMQSFKSAIDCCGICACVTSVALFRVFPYPGSICSNERDEAMLTQRFRVETHSTQNITT